MYTYTMYVYVYSRTVLVEFLYQNGARLTSSDEKGRGCLHYAALKYIGC